MPARFREILPALRACGLEGFLRKGKGSHCILYDGKGHAYTVTVHNGDKSEISDLYLRGICRSFGIDFDVFKSKL